MQKLCFGGKAEGRTFGTATTSKPRLNLLRMEEDLSEAHLRLSRASIENLPWDECLARYDRPDTLFYVDPPYFGMAGYHARFEEGDYQRLADAIRALKGKALVSLNDCQVVRTAFKGFRMRQVKVAYTVGGSTRGQKPSPELVIQSF